LSAAAPRRLIARNAATIPEGIADAELFGNAKNYPNAGMPQRKGLVGEADQSTLFLDEFAELSAGVQARLLRVLDDGEYQSLGDAHARRAAFRLVAASNRPQSALKPDLLARFRFRIELPDLNARREDIPLLVRHLLVSHAPSRAARQAVASASGSEQDLDAQIWCELIGESLRRPYATNVRELAAWLTEATSTSPGQGPILGLPRPEPAAAPASASAATLPPQAATPTPASYDDLSDSGEPHSAAIQAMLDRHNGVLETTWRALGLKNRHVLARLIAKHGLQIRKRPRGRGAPE
jgi:DNA-binding NtrC family response regulator